jgi:hypothetical protein
MDLPIDYVPPEYDPSTHYIDPLNVPYNRQMAHFTRMVNTHSYEAIKQIKSYLLSLVDDLPPYYHASEFPLIDGAWLHCD